MGYYKKYLQQINESLQNMIVSDKHDNEIDKESGLQQWCDLTKTLYLNKKTMFMIGNGASAMMAGHMAADASKNGGFRSVAFNDVALLTAVSNDISYEQCFSVPLKRLANNGDILLTISSSGNSPNILAAITAAKSLNLHVITISGMNKENKSRHMGDLNFYIPANTYGLVEACHQVLLHCWLDKYIELQELV